MILELMPNLTTECCGWPAIDTTESQVAGVWYGRCSRCKDMAQLEEVEDG